MDRLRPEQLKPCPFCGSTNVVLHYMRYRVMCLQCRARTAQYDKEQEAIAAWNQRTQ